MSKANVMAQLGHLQLQTYKITTTIWTIPTNFDVGRKVKDNDVVKIQQNCQLNWNNMYLGDGDKPQKPTSEYENKGWKKGTAGKQFLKKITPLQFLI